MARPLVVAWESGFVDEVLDHLGADIAVDVTLSPTETQWREAPVVLLDARSQSALARLSVPKCLVMVCATGVNDQEAAAVLETARRAWPGVVVLRLPHDAAELRRAVLEAVHAGPRWRVRIGVVGGHGGAGATTLAVALAQAAAYAGHQVLLLDADPLGGGVGARLGAGHSATGRVRVIEWRSDQRRATDSEVAEVILRTPADVQVVDLSRALDPGQLVVAGLCDLVLVVADTARNARATRRVLTSLARARVRAAVVGRSDIDHTTDHVAGDFTTPRAGDMPPDRQAVIADGVVDLSAGGALYRFAADLLGQVPELAVAATL